VESHVRGVESHVRGVESHVRGVESHVRGVESHVVRKAANPLIRSPYLGQLGCQLVALWVGC
jgi:hypothetical protein